MKTPNPNHPTRNTLTWTNVDPKPMPSGGRLSYTLPTGLGKQFVRLLVKPAP